MFLRKIRVARYALPSRNFTRKLTEKLFIPKKMDSDHLNVLNAMSKTVEADFSACHFKYHDDTYLIPCSNLQKKMHAMAQESGRSAAVWVCKEHHNLFQHSVSDPDINSFCAKMTHTKHSQLNEMCLEALIHDCEIEDATALYTLMRNNSIYVSNWLKKSLLDLICSYNSVGSRSVANLEEGWFDQTVRNNYHQRQTWKNGELAELLFSEIEPDSQTYAAMIRGMSKYFQIQRAVVLFQEAIEKQIYLDAETFNSIISTSIFSKEDGESRWEFCQDILKKMNAKGVKPNLGTLNSVLTSIAYGGNSRSAREKSLRVLGEFNSIGIVPSLATWYFLLITFCREKGEASHILIDILDEIDGKEFGVRDPKDTYFFTTAMNVSSNHLHDITVAKRLDTLLRFGNNYALLGDAYKESTYYRHFFAILCQTGPIEEFMKTYDLLVPNVYTPESDIMEKIVKAVDEHEALKYIPKLWSDMIIFDHANRESLINLILQIMYEHYSKRNHQSATHLDEEFNKIAWDIYKRIEEQAEKQTRRLSFSGQMLGNILYILCFGNDFEKAKCALTKLRKNQHQISGNPSIKALAAYIDFCVSRRLPHEAMQCLEFSVEIGLDCLILVEKIKVGLHINESCHSKLERLVVDSQVC